MPTNSSCEEQTLFWQHLARSFCSGAPLLASLHSAQTVLGDTPFAAVVRDLAGQVNRGQTLSEAMAAHPNAFRDHVRCLIEGGERAGILDRVLLLILEFAWRCPSCITAPAPGATLLTPDL